MFHLETDLPSQMLHAMIVRENVRRDAREVFVAADLNKTLQKFSAEPLSLRLVADEQGKFGFIQAAGLA